MARGFLRASRDKVDGNMKFSLKTAAGEISVWKNRKREGAAGKKASPCGLPVRPAKINNRAIYLPQVQEESLIKEAPLRGLPRELSRRYDRSLPLSRKFWPDQNVFIFTKRQLGSKNGFEALFPRSLLYKNLSPQSTQGMQVQAKVEVKEKFLHPYPWPYPAFLNLNLSLNLLFALFSASSVHSAVNLLFFITVPSSGR
jgi:hypothetical protein